MKSVRIAAVAALVVAAAAVAAFASPDQAQSAEEPEAGITVSGVGVVSAVPDRALFSFGVQSEGRTASAALTANAAEMRRVLDALRSAGVAAADLQTQNVSLHPRTNEAGEIVGYTAVNSVSARIRNLDRSGAVIDAAVNAGANQVSGPMLMRGDQTDLYRNAMRAAIADARAKAQTLAQASNVMLGPIVAIQEAPGTAPLPAAERAAADTPVVPGTQELHATVTVTFGLAPTG